MQSCAGSGGTRSLLSCLLAMRLFRPEALGHRPERRPYRLWPMAYGLLVSLVLVLPASAAGALVSHSGRWLTDRSGRVLIMHGLNMVYKLPPYQPSATGFGADDAAFLQRHGFDVVR